MPHKSRLLVVAAIVATLVACGGPAPAGSEGSSNAPVATGSGSAQPAASLPSASVGADPDAAAAVDAFRAFVQTNQSFHLAGDMLMSVGKVTLQAAITSDISNGDEQGTIDIRAPGVSVRLSVVLVDGAAYIRLAKRDWQKAPVRAGFTNPFSGMAVDGLVPVEIVNVDGVRAHHLRVDNPESINGQTLSGNTVTDLTITSSSLDVYITNDGVPLTAIVEFAGSGLLGGERGSVTARIRYDFSEFGQGVEIVPPIVPSP